MKNDVEEITKLQKEILEAEKRIAKAEGKTEELLKQLETNFSCTTKEEAWELLKTKENQRIDLKALIQDKAAALKTAYMNITK